MIILTLWIIKRIPTLQCVAKWEPEALLLLRANKGQKCDRKIFYAEENVSVFCNKALTWQAKVGKKLTIANVKL